jgi:galactosamine-6-phosphate isomerase
MQHHMVNNVKDKPSTGLTLGMADILHSKKIILLITGVNKEKITEQLLTKKITTHLPASLLWLHSNVECFIDLEGL